MLNVPPFELAGHTQRLLDREMDADTNAMAPFAFHKGDNAFFNSGSRKPLPPESDHSSTSLTLPVQQVSLR